MSIFRIIGYGVQGFRRNIWLSVIAIITMTLTIVTVTAFALANFAAVHQYQDFNKKLDYVIFLQDSASDADVTNFTQQIANRPEVAQYVYVSKDDALKKFIADSSLAGDTKDIITPDDNPLPREIDVRFKDPNQFQSFNSFVNQDRFKQLVEWTSYTDNKKLIDSYLRLTVFIRVFGLTFTAFFLLIAVIVILNTIRLTIFSRREEIEVMRLVGATHSFIRGPFIVEGIFFGIIGALVGSLLTWGVLYQLQSLLSIGLGSGSSVAQAFQATLTYITDQQKFSDLFKQLLALQLIIGIGLGSICSAIAIRRYLKE
jgi:cell division transport system permease protein